jgi:hypothetical protein
MPLTCEVITDRLLSFVESPLMTVEKKNVNDDDGNGDSVDGARLRL